jgi:hypothetical protein
MQGFDNSASFSAYTKGLEKRGYDRNEKEDTNKNIIMARERVDEKTFNMIEKQEEQI